MTSNNFTKYKTLFLLVFCTLFVVLGIPKLSYLPPFFDNVDDECSEAVKSAAVERTEIECGITFVREDPNYEVCISETLTQVLGSPCAKEILERQDFSNARGSTKQNSCPNSKGDCPTDEQTSTSPCTCKNGDSFTCCSTGDVCHRRGGGFVSRMSWCGAGSQASCPSGMKFCGGPGGSNRGACCSSNDTCAESNGYAICNRSCREGQIECGNDCCDSNESCKDDEYCTADTCPAGMQVAQGKYYNICCPNGTAQNNPSSFADCICPAGKSSCWGSRSNACCEAGTTCTEDANGYAACVQPPTPTPLPVPTSTICDKPLPRQKAGGLQHTEKELRALCRKNLLKEGLDEYGVATRPTTKR